MKKLFTICLCMFTILQTHAGYEWNSNCNVRLKTVKHVPTTTKGSHRAPYHGEAITSSFDEQAALLTLWFHYQTENTEVIITKDDETVVDETFDMAANEQLECDFTECENGDYMVNIYTQDGLQSTNRINIIQ